MRSEGGDEDEATIVTHSQLDYLVVICGCLVYLVLRCECKVYGLGGPWLPQR